MPRLFPSLSRTRKAKQRLHNDYPVYEDYGRYEQQPQYQPQHYGQAASTLPRVIPHTDSRDRHDGGVRGNRILVVESLNWLTIFD